MTEEITREIAKALSNDSRFQFKQSGNALRQGVCPSCNKKELFVSLDKPFQVKCGRENKCQYTASTRDLYPEFFESFSKRFKSTDQNPNATADAYMRYNRGFDISKLQGMYTQGWKKLAENNFAATVRFQLTEDIYWERLIDAEKIKQNKGRKAHFNFGAKYQGIGWMPPQQTIQEKDVVFISEGIFKCIAFQQQGRKVISGMSCSNLPRKIIQQHAKKDVIWILAYDADKAGKSYARKHAVELDRMGEKFLVALPDDRGSKEDWDDLFRQNRLTQDYIDESLWRGRYHLANNPQQKAFWAWIRRRYMNDHFSFKNALWKYQLDSKKFEDNGELKTADKHYWTSWNRDWLKLCTAFAGCASIERISNCLPRFQYIERDALTEEQFYNFSFEFMNGNKPLQVSFGGDVLESASSWNKALLRQTPGGTFDGNANDLRRIRDRWLDHKMNMVDSVPFIGYHKESETYVFPEFGFHKGQKIEPNEEGYMKAGKHLLKSGMTSVKIHTNDHFDGSWIQDFAQAYSKNGLMLMAWWLGSYFAEQIRAKQGSWPFLEYTGEPGAGKSKQLEFMWRCSGREGWEGFDPQKSTHAGRAREMQQLANLPVVFLEGDRTNDTVKKGSFDMNELKTAFNGGVIRSMGVRKRGAATEAPNFRGTVLISQNAEVSADRPVLERIVHGHCTKDHHTPDLKYVARRLEALSVEDLSGFMFKALSMEKQLLEAYYQAFDILEKKFTDRGGVESRMILNHAQVAAWVYQLPKIFGKAMPARMCQDMEDFIWERCKTRQARVGGDNPDVAAFWENFEYLNERIAEDQRSSSSHAPALKSDRLNHSAKEFQVAIRIPEYMEYASQYGREYSSAKELKELLKYSRSREFIGFQKVHSRHLSKSVNCMVFKDKQEVQK